KGGGIMDGRTVVRDKSGSARIDTTEIVERRFTGKIDPSPGLRQTFGHHTDDIPLRSSAEKRDARRSLAQYHLHQFVIAFGRPAFGSPNTSGGAAQNGIVCREKRGPRLLAQGSFR